MRSTETWISHQKVLTFFSVALHTLHIGTCLGDSEGRKIMQERTILNIILGKKG